MLGVVEMLEQPPPGPDRVTDERPAGMTGGTSKRKFTAMCIVGGLATLACLMLVIAPMILRVSIATYRTEAINNAKQLGLALLEFDQEFGCYPSDKTVLAVVKATGVSLDYTDGSSNAMFRQLIAYGIRSEDIFYVWHPEGTVDPDNYTVGRHALKTKEVGFSYIVGLDTTMDPDTPLLMTPMRTSSHDQFWREGKNYKGKAVVLRLDTSAEAPLIRPSDDKVVDSSGVPILDASQPYFGGRWPDIRHPKMKP